VPREPPRAIARAAHPTHHPVMAAIPASDLLALLPKQRPAPKPPNDSKALGATIA